MFMPESNAPASARTGSHGRYRWLTTGAEMELFLRRAPEIVLGRYIAVTSIDSGVMVLTQEQVHRGWKSEEDVAYSPLIRAADEIPFAGFDEWYIFEKPTSLGELRR